MECHHLQSAQIASITHSQSSRHPECISVERRRVAENDFLNMCSDHCARYHQQCCLIYLCANEITAINKIKRYDHQSHLHKI